MVVALLRIVHPVTTLATIAEFIAMLKAIRKGTVS